jgi:hypothetical protein
MRATTGADDILQEGRGGWVVATLDRGDDDASQKASRQGLRARESKPLGWALEGSCSRSRMRPRCLPKPPNRPTPPALRDRPRWARQRTLRPRIPDPPGSEIRSHRSSGGRSSGRRTPARRSRALRRSSAGTSPRSRPCLRRTPARRRHNSQDPPSRRRRGSCRTQVAVGRSALSPALPFPFRQQRYRRRPPSGPLSHRCPSCRRSCRRRYRSRRRRSCRRRYRSRRPCRSSLRCPGFHSIPKRQRPRQCHTEPVGDRCPRGSWTHSPGRWPRCPPPGGS